MRKLFKYLFGSEKPIERKPHNYYDINGKRYAISENMNFKVQGQDENVTVYGWTLEYRMKDQKGEYYPWTTYFNNRIYQSMSSAIDAAIKVTYGGKQDQDWRVLPLYKMDKNEFRDYKIDKLLTDNLPPKKYEIKAWRVKEDAEVTYYSSYVHKYKKGTIFVQLESGRILKAATKSEPTKYQDRQQLFNNLIPKGIVEEINIKDEKWIHPHLVKELKIKMTK